MDRRSFLATAAAGAVVGTAGCAGGTVVVETQRDVTVQARSGWARRIPRIDGTAAISFIARADRVFETFVFTPDEYSRYQQALATPAGDGPAPTGDTDLGTMAVHDEERGFYAAQTADTGGQEPLEADGPVYFVVDHSAVGMAPLPERPESLSVFVDLTVTKKTLPV